MNPEKTLSVILCFVSFVLSLSFSACFVLLTRSELCFHCSLHTEFSHSPPFSLPSSSRLPPLLSFPHGPGWRTCLLPPRPTSQLLRPPAAPPPSCSVPSLRSPLVLICFHYHIINQVSVLLLLGLQSPPLCSWRLAQWCSYWSETCVGAEEEGVEVEGNAW